MLLEGTKIYSNQWQKDRVMLSKGTLQTHCINGQTYSKPVIIPRNEWRTPDAKEHQKLAFSWRDTPDYQQISIIKLPQSIIDTIKQAKIAECSHRQAVFDIAESDYWNDECLPLLERHLQQWITAEDELLIHPFFVGEPNLETVTQDKNDHFTGLHLDSWEAAERLEDRKYSRNRICINLGKEPRYFLVLNLNLEQCFAHSHHSKTTDFATLRRNEYVHVWEFLYDFPDYPITRIKVEPYEAYIAPTEYMIHDGSTFGSRSLDIHLTFRAHFRYRPSLTQRLSQLLQ